MQESSWITGNSREMGLKKIDDMISFLGYPEVITDHQAIKNYFHGLTISKEHFFENKLRLSRFWRMKLHRELHYIPNRHEMSLDMDSLSLNAYYDETKNQINIPAALLGGDIFSTDVPKYLNYGGVGNIVGHELVHLFDDYGHLFDNIGNKIDWWDSRTKTLFEEKAKCFENQYGNCKDSEKCMPLIETSILSENIAEKGGANMAYIAYGKDKIQSIFYLSIQSISPS